MLIDSHAHLDFYDDPAPILAAAHAAGVHQILAVGIGNGPATMHRALDLAHANSGIFASAGIHPQQAHEANPEALAQLTQLAQDPKCIAIGEIGLDYYHLDNPSIDVQQQAFIAQMGIAAAARKPILIHCRTSELATPQAKARFYVNSRPADAASDLLTLLEQHWAPTGLPGILHCFSGTSQDAARALALGFYLSFAGNLTYPKSTVIQQVAAQAPADRILVETDSPFLAPIPLRGQQNQPAHITHTAAFLAQLRNTTPELIAHQTTANFQTLFPTTKQS